MFSHQDPTKTPPTAQELFDKMQNEGVAEFMKDQPLETLKVSKDEIAKNEHTLIKHTVDLHLDSDNIPEFQKYTLLSFIDPEESLDAKEVFVFSKFMDSFAKSMGAIFDQFEEQMPELAPKLQGLRIDTYKHLFHPELLQNTYRIFRKENYENLKQDFYKLNEFRTSERGFKIRGCYGSIEEAQQKAKSLKELGDPFNIFIGQMGHWMPFNPPTDSIQNQEYAIEELNTLMKHYKDKQVKQEDDYENRKNALREIVQLKDQPKPQPETIVEEQEQE